MALGKFKEALKDLKVVSKRAPGDKDAKAKLDECSKIVKRIEFEKAIEVNNNNNNLIDTVISPSAKKQKNKDEMS